MTDRELLEAAARAAGYELQLIGPPQEQYLFRVVDGNAIDWNPLEDDADALRLAVKLGLEVSVAYAQVYACRFGSLPGKELSEPHGDDVYAATRRAIVRAAAALAQEPA